MRVLNKYEISKLNGSKLDYKYIIPSSKKEIVFTCNKHGEIKQRFDVHVRTLNCPICNNEKKNLKYNKEYILNKIKKLNNNYSYKIEDRFYKVNEKINIICKKHGCFKQTIHNHIYIKNKCPKCSKEEQRKPSKKLLDFIKIHKIKLLEYKGSREKSSFKCINNHIFKSTVSNLKEHKCSKCSREYLNLLEREKFIIKSKIIWENIIHIDYDTLIYSGKRRKIYVITEIGIIEQLPDNHLKGFLPKKSTGEEIIKNILKKRNIKYEREKTFDGCVNKKKLRFDFYLPKEKTCIEFNGIQHYKPIDKFGGVKKFYSQIKNDKIKKDWCQQNNITLIIISYNDSIIEKIKEIYDK